MKDICVWFVVVSGIVFGVCYVFQIWRGQAIPTLSTWIIFVVGCGLSFFTYVIAENRDLKSGVLNTLDLVYVTTTLVATILWGKHEVRFKPHEKWYLAAAAGIVIYGLVSGDAWSSNVLTQILMSLAYAPMFHKFFTLKKNTESFFAWVSASTNALVALYPAIHEGNSLAVIYALLALTFSLSTTLLMAYYQIKSQRVSPPTLCLPKWKT